MDVALALRAALRVLAGHEHAGPAAGTPSEPAGEAGDPAGAPARDHPAAEAAARDAPVLSEAEQQRLVSPLAEADERVIEGALRPKRLAEFVGQSRVREQLSLVLEGAMRRGRAPDHVLLSGPPGLGKTTIAMIIAAELGAQLRITSGPAIERAGDLAAILSTLGERDVVFIDEIHRVARPAEEMLYIAMEDFRVDVVVGKGPGATAIPLDIAPFTLVGATTRAGLLPAPLRDRFGFTAHLDFYEPAELEVDRAPVGGPARRRAARRRGGGDRPAGPAAPRASPTGCCAGSATTPRCARTAWSPATLARAALELYEVDDKGLDRLDRAVLGALVLRFGGGPVGLSTLAVAVGEEAETVEVVAEPFLVRSGLIARTPRGRVATAAAWQHLGLIAPEPPGLTAPVTLFELTGRGYSWSRACHDHSPDPVACWCVACAPLHCGSWSTNRLAGQSHSGRAGSRPGARPGGAINGRKPRRWGTCISQLPARAYQGATPILIITVACSASSTCSSSGRSATGSARPSRCRATSSPVSASGRPRACTEP